MVGVEEIHAWYCLDSKVVLDPVLHFGPILDEERVPSDVVDKIVLKAKMIDAVNGNTAIPAVVDGAVVLVAAPHVTYHVPMYSIAAQPEGLSSVAQL